MKKAILVIAVLLSATMNINAQQGSFIFEASVMAPVSSPGVSEHSLGANLGFSYLFKIDKSFYVGPSVNVEYFEPKEHSESAMFLPVTIAAQYILFGSKYKGEAFSIGANVGYGMGLSPDGNEGGFYYRPYLRYGIWQAAFSSTNVDGGSFSAFQFGMVAGF